MFPNENIWIHIVIWERKIYNIFQHLEMSRKTLSVKESCEKAEPSLDEPDIYGGSVKTVIPCVLGSVFVLDDFRHASVGKMAHSLPLTLPIRDLQPFILATPIRNISFHKQFNLMWNKHYPPANELHRIWQSWNKILSLSRHPSVHCCSSSSPPELHLSKGTHQNQKSSFFRTLLP